MKEAIKNAVAEAAKAYGAEGYEVKMGSSTSAAVEALKDDISSVTYEKSKSISVRCVKSGKSGYASGNIVTPEEAAELVRRACESALVVDDADEVPLFEGSPEYKEVEKKEVVIPSAEDMIKVTMELQTKLMGSEKVVEGSQSFMQVSASESSFFNSAGLDLDYESGYVAKGAVAAVKDGDDAEENYEMKFADEITNDDLVKLAVDGAVAKLGGKPVDSGKYNIIMENGAMRSILSVFSGLFSARSAFLKTTMFAGKEGESRGLMTSFNRIGQKWTGGDYRLCTEILRDEWGFKGTVICDFNTHNSFKLNLCTKLGYLFKQRYGKITSAYFFHTGIIFNLGCNRRLTSGGKLFKNFYRKSCATGVNSRSEPRRARSYNY